MTKKHLLGLVDLINQMKNELLNSENKVEINMFCIDEIILEVNFTISGDIESGFDLGVVTLGSTVNEEQVQKVTVKLTPLVSKNQLIDEINKDSKKSESVLINSTNALVRGN
jgi:hypothetical protein